MRLQTLLLRYYDQVSYQFQRLKLRPLRITALEVHLREDIVSGASRYQDVMRKNVILFTALQCNSNVHIEVFKLCVFFSYTVVPYIPISLSIQSHGYHLFTFMKV